MRGQRDICLLCRHAFQSRTPFTPPKRFVSSPRNVEPYVLPRLVIDLDAADSKYVRPAEEVPEEELPPLRAIRSGSVFKQDGLTKLRDPRPKVPLRILAVNPVDIWSFALLGLSHSSPTSANARIGSIMKRKGIHQTDSVEDAMAHFMDGFSMDAAERLRRAGFTSENKEAISKHILYCHTWSNLRSYISLLSSTKEGCLFLSGHGQFILNSIRRCRKSQADKLYHEEVTPEMILSLLNNLRLNMNSKGVGMGAALCNAGLYYAVKALNLPAVHLYLQYMRQAQYTPSWRARGALASVFRAMEDGPHRRIRDPNQKIAALELITGWEGGTHPRGGEPRNTCFAGLAFGNSQKEFCFTIYPKYIMGLGELGLTDAIYAEWMAPDESRMDNLIRGDEHLRFRAQMFAVAFLLAQEPQRALQVLESIPTDHEDPSTSTYDPRPLQDWRPQWSPKDERDLKISPKSSPMWLLSVLYDHYHFHNCRPIHGLRGQLAERVGMVPNEPELALEALRKMLLLDANELESAVTNKHGHWDISWSEKDGVEGVHVSSP